MTPPYNPGMPKTLAAIVLTAGLAAGCGMKGDLYEPAPPPVPVNEPAPGQDPATPDGRKTIPAEPAPDQSR